MKIIPIRDLKDTSKISEMCHESDEPIFVTKNGYQDMVIMSSDAYDRITSTTRYYVPTSLKNKVAEDVIAYEPPAQYIYSVDEIKRVLKPIFDNFKVKKAILFGSYAKGIANEKSDIDIFVNSGLKGLHFFGLLEAVSNAFSCPIDLIDAQDVVKGSRIEDEIKNTGIKIYGK